MSKKRRHERGNPFVVLVLLIVLLGGLYYLNEFYEPGPPATRSKSGDFIVLEGCRLIEDPNRNDGDSFRVRHGDEQYVIRLYFVDCPEKRVHSYDKDRIAEQGRYFGGLSEKETIKLGLDARDVTLNLVRKNDFSVLTKWEEVYTSGRFYGLVRFEEGGPNPLYLHQILVQEGLARIYTRGLDIPGETKSRHLKRLQNFEKQARKKGKGGWH